MRGRGRREAVCARYRLSREEVGVRQARRLDPPGTGRIGFGERPLAGSERGGGRQRRWKGNLVLPRGKEIEKIDEV